jgi:hypothetical protein
MSGVASDAGSLDGACLRAGRGALAWSHRHRPFTAWLRGADLRAAEVVPWSGDRAMAELDVVAGALTAVARGTGGARAVHGQLRTWVSRQRGWLEAVESGSPEALSEVTAACAWLEAREADPAERSLVDRYLTGLCAAHAGGSADRRGRLAAMAAGLGLSSAAAKLAEPPDREDRQDRQAADRASEPIELPVLVAALRAAARAYRAPDTTPERCGAALSRPRHRAGAEAVIRGLYARLRPAAVSSVPMPRVRPIGRALSSLAPAMYRPCGPAGEVYLDDRHRRPVAACSAPVLLVFAHETFPGHAWHAVHTDPALRELSPVLRDGAGVEGWAFLAEAELSGVCPHLAEEVLRTRVRRLLPVAVVETRRHRGSAAARRLLGELDAIAPTLLRRVTGHGAVRAGRVYAEGLLGTQAALDGLRAAHPATPDADIVAAYLAGAGMAPVHAAEWAGRRLAAARSGERTA